MNKSIALACILALAGCQSIVQEKTSFASAFPADQWAKSGGGSQTVYRCKNETCGGKKTEVFAARFYGAGAMPELGIGGEKDLESEFRSRPSVRNTLSAMLRRMVTTDGDQSASISMNYYSNSNQVGYVIKGFSPKENSHIYGKVVIDGNEVLLVGASSPDASRPQILFSRFIGSVSFTNGVN